MALTECPHCKAGHVCHTAPGQHLHPVDRLEEEIGDAYKQVVHSIRVREEASHGGTGGILKTALFEMVTRLEALAEAHALITGAISYPSHPLRTDVRRHANALFNIDLDALTARVRAA